MELKKKKIVEWSSNDAGAGQTASINERSHYYNELMKLLATCPLLRSFTFHHESPRASDAEKLFKKM